MKLSLNHISLQTTLTSIPHPGIKVPKANTQCKIKNKQQSPNSVSNATKYFLYEFMYFYLNVGIAHEDMRGKTN